MWNQVSYDARSYECNLCNWVYRSLKYSGLQQGLNLWPWDNAVMLSPTELWSSWCWELVMWGSQGAREEWMWNISKQGLTTVRCSNQQSYEATNVGSWSFVGRKEPVRNECEVIMWNIWNIELRMWNEGSYDPRSYESNLCNCVYESLQKVGTLTGFETVTQWHRCDALTNWAMKPLTLGAGHFWALGSPSRMNVKS